MQMAKAVKTKPSKSKLIMFNVKLLRSERKAFARKARNRTDGNISEMIRKAVHAFPMISHSKTKAKNGNGKAKRKAA